MKEQVEKIAEMLSSSDKADVELGRRLLDQCLDTLSRSHFVEDETYRLHYFVCGMYTNWDGSTFVGMIAKTTTARYTGWTVSAISGKPEPCFNTTVSGVIATERI